MILVHILFCLQTQIGKNESSPGIFIDAGIHSREWIAPATALYIINQVFFIFRYTTFELLSRAMSARPPWVKDYTIDNRPLPKTCK